MGQDKSVTKMSRSVCLMISSIHGASPSLFFLCILLLHGQYNRLLPLFIAPQYSYSVEKRAGTLQHHLLTSLGSLPALQRFHDKEGLTI